MRVTRPSKQPSPALSSIQKRPLQKLQGVQDLQHYKNHQRCEHTGVLKRPTNSIGGNLKSLKRESDGILFLEEWQVFPYGCCGFGRLKRASASCPCIAQSAATGASDPISHVASFASL
mmetsp:Transcript_90592/g.143088  ORF Transcript_90592/g.143088 Transcript_90592/m.143088 type:complete len:118 (-) Transcript_90592:3113-3466(-)